MKPWKGIMGGVLVPGGGGKPSGQRGSIRLGTCASALHRGLRTACLLLLFDPLVSAAAEGCAKCVLWVPGR